MVVSDGGGLLAQILTCFLIFNLSLGLGPYRILPEALVTIGILMLPIARWYPDVQHRWIL